MAAVLVPLLLDLAAEVDGLGLVYLGDEPGVAQAQPVVGQLHLLPVHNLLLENAQLVADGVAPGGYVQGGHGVQIAGGQTAQTAVSESRVGLGLEEVGGVEAKTLDGLGQRLHHAQIVGVLHQGPAHEKLQGQVVDLPGVGVLHAVLGLQLVGGHDVAEDQGAGLEHVCPGRLVHVPAEIAAELADDEVGQLGFGICMQRFHLPDWCPGGAGLSGRGVHII